VNVDGLGSPRRDRAWEPRAEAPPRLWYDAASRVLDVIVALVGLVLPCPLWLVVGATIRLTSPGPALFRATVVGRGGRPFTYFKFRTMVAGDDGHHRRWLREYVTRDAPYREGIYKVVEDDRVTPVGRVLRRFSLDEVPQLLNVLRGEMSVVGPRPPLAHEWELYDAGARCRLSVKPGITGLYQVTARSRVPFSRMLAIDLDYVRRRSLWLDLRIMARTAGVMLSGRGAA
jgi:lipopolysaccharide/colanic/teichoic acid biosynthesis glycosyltransferase